ncbi:MAG: glycosyltransferase family 4 protein [Chitinophagaceae bacterium]
MKIVIVSDESFFSGTAQENRQLAYARGFYESGHSVKIITLVRVDQQEERKILNDIEVEYLDHKKKAGISGWQKIRTIRSSIKLCKVLRRENRQQKIDCVIIQTFSNISVVFAYFITRVLKIKLIRDQAEYPFIHKPAYGKITLFLYTKYFYRFFDGLAVVNDALMDYFKGKIRKKAKMIKFPMIVDPRRFQEESRKPTNDNYIAYCGDMRNNKDGLPLLLDAFKIISEKHTGIRLYLIGNTVGVGEADELKQQMKNLELDERIVFTGRISRDEMPGYLNNATALVLSRPNSKQTEGGFPTKLGEYLATGRPVVVTKVGEIPSYLIDDTDAFLSEPDVESFAGKLNHVLSNPEFANRVGQNGKRLAYTTFNYKVQAQNLVSFINALN